MSKKSKVEDSSAPGWDAITAQLDSVYGNQKPLHHGASLPSSLGGKHALQGTSVYRNRAADGDWFHYVTYGYSELYDKELEDLEYSGYGFEMTLRLATVDIDKDPPAWPISLLENLARYVFQSGNIFQVGHYLPFNGPIVLGSSTKIRAGFFTQDDLLGSIETPNGRVEFLQLVGCTEDEILELKRWNAAGFEATMRQVNPRLLIDLDRDSIVDDPKIAKILHAGAQRHGSETEALYAQNISLDEPSDGPRILHLPANVVEDFVTVLPARLNFDQIFFLQTEDALIGICPADIDNFADTQAECTALIFMTPDDVRCVANSIKPIRGDYPIRADLVVRVHPKKIKDQDGKVTHVVG